MVRNFVEFISGKVAIRIFNAGKTAAIECFLYGVLKGLLTRNELGLCIQNYQQAINTVTNAPVFGNEDNRTVLIRLWTTQLDIFKRELSCRG